MYNGNNHKLVISDQKVQTTVRKAIIKRIKHNKRKSMLLVGVKNHVIALKNSRADPKKIKNRSTM